MNAVFQLYDFFDKYEDIARQIKMFTHIYANDPT